MRREDEIDTFINELDAKLENILTRDDLVQFVGTLLIGVKEGVFEEQDLKEYVSGLYGIIAGLDGLQKNTGISNPDPPDWKLIGRILFYAFYHS